MLSLFPDLLDWSWYVPFFFRLFLGTYLLYIGWTTMKVLKTHAIKNSSDLPALLGAGMLLFTLGLLFLLGVVVQALGAIGFALALYVFFLRRKKTLHLSESPLFYVLIGIVSLSLVFLGAGPYAFDLPL